MMTSVVVYKAFFYIISFVGIVGIVVYVIVMYTLIEEAALFLFLDRFNLFSQSSKAVTVLIVPLPP